VERMGRRDCECPLLRMQAAPNSHRSSSPKDAGPSGPAEFRWQRQRRECLFWS
jgi:hypothetical protein